MTPLPFILAISGTPGTGKTSIAKELSLSLRWKHIELTKFIKENHLSTGYDSQRHCEIVDPQVLAKRLGDYISSHDNQKGIIIDGHMAHLLPKGQVDLCIITKTGLSALRSRLRRRKYDNSKITENLQAEIFEVCLIEAQDIGHDILVVDTTNVTPEKLAKSISSKCIAKINRMPR